jgi:hypothetical protein
LDSRNDETCLCGLNGAIAKLEYLVEVLPGVDVQHGEGELLGREGLGGKVQQHRRVLAAREEQDRSLALGNDLAQNKQGVRLENIEVVSGVRGVQGRCHDLFGWIVF